MDTSQKAERPVILAVDDEPAVLSAVARDLRREYGEQYRVMRADSGVSALELVRQLKLRNTPVALFLVDQRMPLMSGVDFLAEAMEIFPDARRVLLTAYADTQAAISAINEVALNHYLMKPWDPPEEHLYPVLTDLLDDWQASFAPPSKAFALSVTSCRRNHTRSKTSSRGTSCPISGSTSRSTRKPATCWRSPAPTARGCPWCLPPKGLP